MRRYLNILRSITVPAVILALSAGCSGPSEITITGYNPEKEISSENASSAALYEMNSDHTAESSVYEQDGAAAGGDHEESVRPESVQTADSEDEPGIAVYVCGAVQEPDVYYLPAGARIYDALDAAGGFSADADTQWLNQARLVSDGEMLLVYTLDETAKMMEEGAKRGSASGGNSSAADSGNGFPAGESIAASSVVNLNTGSKEQLMTLPGIGESKADAIIRYRSENGSFASVEDVMNISGIKDSTFEKIKDRITV